MRLLVLVTDAFGGRGGIAHHNRLLLEALCAAPRVSNVVAVPRLIVDAVGPIPKQLTYVTSAATGKTAYLQTLARMATSGGPFDVVICGHLNLLPLAAPLAWRYRTSLVQIVHGIDAWTPPNRLVHRFIRAVDVLVSVSDFTRRKVLAWADLGKSRSVVIPNGIDLSDYSPGPRRQDLVGRYRLNGKKVILILGRMSASERYKGHDELLEVLPELAQEIPEVVLLVAGDGDDRTRLEAKAERLGVADRVVWAGYVPDHEKMDTLRLADVFAMPGRGEGFGIVYLEALACGVPVIASSADASQEAVLGGQLGAVVDPNEPHELLAALYATLQAPPGGHVPPALQTFGRSALYNRWHRLLDGLNQDA